MRRRVGIAAQRRADERAHCLWVAGYQSPGGEEEREVLVRYAVFGHEEVAQVVPRQLRLDALPGVEAPSGVNLAIVERLEDVQLLRRHQLDAADPAVRDDQVRDHRHLELR